MTPPDLRAVLHEYLQDARDAMLWKLDDLSEYDLRRPLTPTGTNLLGLVKHLTGVEIGYLGATFGRPFAEPPPWLTEPAEDNVDMWARPHESRERIIDLYRQVWRHSDATLNAYDLDTHATVAPWPPERREVTLQQIVVHVIAETHRHAGHADIVRELIDGSAGRIEHNDNLPEHDAAWWSEYRQRVERAARDTSSR